MKRLTQLLDEQEDARREALNERRRKRQELLEAIEAADIQPFVAQAEYDKTDYHVSQENVREGLRTGRVELYHAGCDWCGTQLVLTAPGIMLCSNPPKQHIGCPGCGWIGYVGFGV